MKVKSLWVGFLAVVVWVSVSSAAIFIEVGHHTLMPDQPGQVVDILVTGAEAVQGLNLYVQLGDGGLINGGVDDAPIITNVDVVGAGTVFNESNTGQVDALSSGKLWGVSVTTDRSTKPTVNAAGVLAHLTFDTTGAALGQTIPLILTGVAASQFPPTGIDTDFAGVLATIQNGSITIPIPEPVTAVVVLAGSAAFALIRRRPLCLN